MVKEKMISVTKLKVVEAAQNFIAKYFDDEILAVSYNSSQASKARVDKGYYKINFVYEGVKDKVPSFLQKEDYVTEFKKDFSEWLGVQVKYFYVDWSLTADKSDKDKETIYGFCFAIELRI